MPGTKVKAIVGCLVIFRGCWLYPVASCVGAIRELFMTAEDAEEAGSCAHSSGRQLRRLLPGVRDSSGPSQGAASAYRWRFEVSYVFRHRMILLAVLLFCTAGSVCKRPGQRSRKNSEQPDG